MRGALAETRSPTQPRLTVRFSRAEPESTGCWRRYVRQSSSSRSGLLDSAMSTRVSTPKPETDPLRGLSVELAAADLDGKEAVQRVNRDEVALADLDCWHDA